MNRSRLSTLTALATVGAMFAAACSGDGIATPLTAANSGTIVVRLTDAPFLSDSVQSVDIFVVRLDARQADVDSANADSNLNDGTSSASGWTTVASPNASFDLLSLQNGVTAILGQATLAAGTYNGFRLIIDPSKSSVTLKGGRVLAGNTTPGVTFPSASRSGIKIQLEEPVQIVAGATSDLLVDFKVNDSFVMRGNSIDRNGLLFKPVIKASITNLALTNAKVRLVNATSSTLEFLQSGTVLTGGSDIAFGASSACSSVNATTPALSVTLLGSATPLPGFAPTLTAGNSFSIVAFPNSTGGVDFSTLPNAFAPASGQAGLRVFNASGIATGMDVFVTPPAAPLGTATFSNVLTGASAAFVSVPAGATEIRLTATGTTTVLFDLPSETLTAGQNVTLVIAPPASGSTTPRAFLVAGC